MKTLTSGPQGIVPMLPQLSVQPKNKEAYRAAPLRPLECGAESSDPCVKGNKLYTVSTSVVARLGHIPKKGAGEFWGWRRCCSGLNVVVVCPKPARHTPMRRNTANTGGSAADVERLAGQTR